MTQTTLLAVALAFGSTALFAADPQLLNMAPADAAMYAGINVEQAKTSQFGQFLLSEVAVNGGFDTFIAETGFDPRRDLSEVLVATGSASPTAPATGAPALGGAGLVLAKGNFNLPQILAAAAKDQMVKVSTYSGVTFLTINDSQALALVDASTAVAGDVSGVKAALDRRTGSTAISPVLMARINQLSTSEDAWSVSTGNFGSLLPQIGNSGTQPAVLAGLQQASGGVKFGSNVQVTAQAVAATAQDASSLGDIVKLMVQMVSMQGSANHIPPALTSLLKSLVINTDGSTLNISLTLPEDQIESVFKMAHQQHTDSAAI